MKDEITGLKLTHAMLRKEVEETIARLEGELANACAEREQLRDEVKCVKEWNAQRTSQFTCTEQKLATEIAYLTVDRERLDWLDAEALPKPGTYPVAALTVKAGYDRNSSEWANIIGTARQAIDEARKH